MALLGLGILVASLVFLLYRQPPAIWLRESQGIMTRIRTMEGAKTGDDKQQRQDSPKHVAGELGSGKVPGGVNGHQISEGVHIRITASDIASNNGSEIRNASEQTMPATTSSHSTPAAYIPKSDPDRVARLEASASLLAPELAESYGRTIDSILRESDLTTVTTKMIRLELQATTGDDLSSREIRPPVDSLIHLRFDAMCNAIEVKRELKSNQEAGSTLPPSPRPLWNNGPSEDQPRVLQIPGSAPVPPQKEPQQNSAASLMPPPPVRPSALPPLPRASGTASSLMPPPSVATSLRILPSRALASSVTTSARNSVAASTSTLPPTSRPSRKVILSPGHSPLDWANLTRNPPSATFLRGEGIPPRLLKVSPTQLKHYNGRKGRDAWGVYQGKVYNLTPYKDFHPGGVGELMRGAGKPGEAERLFNEVHPWVNWDGMLNECLIGVLVGVGEGEGEQVVNGGVDVNAID